MKNRLLIPQLLALIVFSLLACVNPKNSNLLTTVDGCYKGKLVISGICKQKAVVLLSSNSGNLAIDSSWINPDDGQLYKNVFSVKNVCDFPENIKVGDTFDFKIATAQKSDCAVCLAYIPTPSSQLFIEVGCK